VNVVINCGICQARRWRHGDKDQLVFHANNQNVSAQLRDKFPSPYTAEEAQKWLAFATQQQPLTDFAIECEGTVVGGIGLQLHGDIERCSAEVGYWLGESVWGRGIAAAALRGITEYGFTTFEFSRIYALPFADNLRSRRVLEKAGFEYEGTLRKNVIKRGLCTTAQSTLASNNSELSVVDIVGRSDLEPGGTLEFMFKARKFTAAGHMIDESLERQMLAWGVKFDLAKFENDEVIANKVGMMRVVRDEDDPDASVARRSDVFEYNTRLFDAECGGGFVKDQHSRTEVDGARNSDDLPLSARKSADGLFDVGHGDAHLLELFVRDRAHFVRVEASQHGASDADFTSEEEVSPDRQQRYHGKVLVDGGDAAVERFAGRMKVHRMAIHEIGAGIVRVESADDFDKRGLAGAVITKNTGHFSGAD